MRRAPRIGILALTLLGTLATLVACRPATGADRSLGTFRIRYMFGYQAITFERNGKATYVMVAPGDDDKPETETLPGTYQVMGDTTFVTIDWREPEDEGKVLALMIRGDTLVMLNQLFGRHQMFLRDP